MPSYPLFLLAIPLSLAMLTPAHAQPNPITMKGLIHEMVTPDSLARWPQPSFTVRQASSYDQARIAPDKPGWFANRDGSNYLRSEEHDGHQEQVMMDADGPGAIVRFHLTNAGSLEAPVRIYLDGATTPTIEFPLADLTSGDLHIGGALQLPEPPPTGHGAATLYLPIPYARHCKVTLEEKDPKNPGGRYYHIDYRTYTPGTPVETFSWANLNALRPQIAQVNQLLQAPSEPIITHSVELARNLEGGGVGSLDLPSGPAAVRQIELSIGPDLSPALREAALRSIVLRAAFDDEPESIWCPVGDFIGSGVGGRPLSSWYRDVDEHGNAICRWTMPYRKGGKFTLQNLGTQNVQVKMVVRSGAWNWDERSLYFHCNWHQQVGIPSDPPRDWNFLSVQGRGLLVGDVMSVYNPLPSWYGEGNEKIWVDNEAFPSHIGTRTEDYYNASWAPNPLYQTPFANHPRMDDPLSQGHNVYTRTRNLDTVPFEKALQFDFEILTWKPSDVDYAATTYWYGAPGARANWVPQPEEARRPLPVMTPPLALPGALEAELLPIIAHSPGLVVEPQDMRPFNGAWSGRAQLLVRGQKVGDFVEIAIPAPGNKPRHVMLYATRANDYGILKFSVNGQSMVTAPFDGYAPDPTPLAAIPLGIFTPKNGQLLLRAELVGTNDHSVGKRYLAALDAVVLEE